MTVSKSDIKMFTIANLGAKIDDLLEDQHKLLQQAKGAGDACGHLSTEITKQILGALNKDIDAGKYESLEHPTEIKRWIVRCSELASHLAIIAKEKEIRLRGGIDQLTRVIDFMKKEHEAEKNKKELLLKASEGKVINDETNEGEGTVIPMRRPMGVHPGLSIKARRRMQENDDAAQGAAPVTVDAAQDATQGAAPVTTEEPVAEVQPERTEERTEEGKTSEPQPKEELTECVEDAKPKGLSEGSGNELLMPPPLPAPIRAPSAGDVAIGEEEKPKRRRKKS